MKIKSKLALFAAAVLAATTATASFAQKAPTAEEIQHFPTKPVRLVVGFPPGGLADIMARLIAEKLTATWKQQVIVETRAGASGAIAGDLVARAPADGYTLMAILTNHVILPSVQPKLNFDPIKDFTPISLMGSAPVMILANPKLPVKNIQELVALAKSKPGTLTYSTPGNSSIHHLAIELMQSQLGIQMIHVPYTGGAPAMTDAIAGTVNMNIGSPAQAIQQIKAGQLKALTITSSKRSPMLPDVPTVTETVMPGFTAGLWSAILGPRNMPKPLVDRINADITAILKTPEMQERMIQLGVETIASTPDELGTFMVSEMQRWGKVAKDAGVTTE
jgi:tripartite-type tricarboxylate transporter receptor subunit TctC